jgi:calcineurin-like phosphoesterase family protein
MKRYWIADIHFGHASIVKYCNRPTLKKKDLGEDGDWVSPEVAVEAAKRMDNFIIKNCNSRVKSDDMVVHVGDFINSGLVKGVQGLRNKPKFYLDQLNGTWTLLAGNHDRNNNVKPIANFMVADVGPYKAFISHYPIENENIFSKELTDYVISCTDFQITAHVHQAWTYKFYQHKYANYLMYNVGIDVHRYFPIPDDKIISDISKIIT